MNVGQVTISVTRLGDYWKFLPNIFIAKVAQIFDDFLANLKTTLSDDVGFKLEWDQLS